MKAKHDHRNITVERKLGLPKKEEEIQMFLNYDLVAVFDRYLPLADYLLDDYICPNNECRILAEETVYQALLVSIIKFRRLKRYELDTTFTFFFSYFVADLMNDFIKEGKAYRVSSLQVESKQSDFLKITKTPLK